MDLLFRADADSMVSLPESIGGFEAAVPSMPDYAREMLAGGVAGVVAKTAVAPLGRVKLLRRIGGAPGAEAEGAVRTLIGIYRREGFVGLYRGNGANALRVFPSKALHFAAYERYRGWLGGGAAVPSSLVDLLAGSAAGGTALLATYPLDLARARLACGGDGSCTSVRGVLRAAYAEGGARGLYRGAWPGLVRALPRSGIKFWAYESLKRRLPEGWDGRAEAQMACGVAAAQLASTATYPLAVVRRRMQLGLCAGGGVLQGVRAIAREEGVRRLYAGLGIAYVKAVPSAAIGLVAYDQMKAIMKS
jgi:solute carrier family 25 protein 16